MPLSYRFALNVMGERPLSECGSGYCLNVGVATVWMWEWPLFKCGSGYCLNVGVAIV